MDINTFRSIISIIMILACSKFGSANLSNSTLVNNNLKHEINRAEGPSSGDRVTAFRFRSNFQAELDEDGGWAAGINESVTLQVDVPFRIRFEVESNAEKGRRQYGLQYKRNEETWQFIEAHEFPYPSAATPPISIVGCKDFFFGEEADDLIDVSDLPSDPGSGICLAPTTPGWIPGEKTGASVEWEWALVVRHWTDGPGLVNTGDRIALRMVDGKGLPLSGAMPEIVVHVPPKHIGGTFVETPTRIGPYENSMGELYFIMEPTETDNVFMMIKSTDGGDSWYEIDPNNRPREADLEGVGSVISPDGVIHIVHETSHYVYYHAFATSDFGGDADKWIVKDQVITEIEEPPVQTADIALRPDGSIATVYAVGTTLQYSILAPNGTWGESLAIAPTKDHGLTNPALICKPDGTIEIAYKSSDGKGWNQQLLHDNTMTSAQMFADDLGTNEEESMAILPLVYLPASGKTVVLFRTSDGFLYGKAKSEVDSWSKAILVSDRPIVTNAVDSDQAGADVVAHGDEMYITFIAEDDRDIYLSVIKGFEQTASITKIIPDINGSWIRGNMLNSQQNSPCYGFIYDAGSKGGSGYNRFFSYQIKP